MHYTHTPPYDDTFLQSIRELDRSRPYWPASPSNGALVDRPDLGLYVQRWGSEQDSRWGDVHTYPNFNTDSDCENLRLFQSARFVSEYGFTSWPNFAALVPVTEPQDWTSNSTQVSVL
jgi:beta-mannosidase